jgi:2,3-bisphosphoglycerate-dependent phosphoglycerate mutase
VRVSSQAVPQPTRFLTESGATEVLLIRHGRSADVVPGSEESLDPPLHADGRIQAETLGRRLAPDRKRIDAVYASDLRRAVATAAYLAEPRGLVTNQRQTLREVWLGDWEAGEFRRRAMVRDPEWLTFAESGRWDLVPNGEGDVALRTRVRTAIEAIVADHPDQTVAVVAHGGVIQAYLAEILANPRSVFADIENTSVTVVRAVGDVRTVGVVNDCSHLYDPVIGPPLG